MEELILLTHLELLNFLAQILVRQLCVLIRLERDVPRIIVSKFAGDKLRTVHAGEQVLEIGGEGMRDQIVVQFATRLNRNELIDFIELLRTLISSTGVLFGISRKITMQRL